MNQLTEDDPLTPTPTLEDDLKHTHFIWRARAPVDYGLSDEFGIYATWFKHIECDCGLTGVKYSNGNSYWNESNYCKRLGRTVSCN